MLPTENGAVRIFRFLGIDVFLHWSWFVIALLRYQMLAAGGGYDSNIFYLFEVLGLFGIVLVHEYGHSLACRQVGGIANRIVLWPLGGVAYVQPPERPGAQLWSIAAGPLVNVALVPILLVVYFTFRDALVPPDVVRFIATMGWINFGLLLFNVLPIYPLDGGQILRSILWFFTGRARSLQIAAGIGIVAAIVLFLVMVNLFGFDLWLAVMAFFIVSQAARGWKIAQAMRALEQTPRREEYECPFCHVSPPAGALWVCQRCGNHFDTFADGGRCQHCQAHYADTQCANCGQWSAVESWRVFGRAVRMTR
jgi:Zn-dependent protease